MSSAGIARSVVLKLCEGRLAEIRNERASRTEEALTHIGSLVNFWHKLLRRPLRSPAEVKGWIESEGSSPELAFEYSMATLYRHDEERHILALRDMAKQSVDGYVDVSVEDYELLRGDE